MAWGGSTGHYDYPLASGQLATAWGVATVASNYYTTAFGDRTQATAENATAWGTSTIASGVDSTAFGQGTFARGASETSIGLSGTDYTPAGGLNGFMDRLLTVGNGGSLFGGSHNAYTLFADGSFTYNDDNFQNDTPGEQNMFYFNYGNHNGNGGLNSKKAIRLGSTSGGDWDIASTSVGDKSIALGFGSVMYGHPNPIASGTKSFAVLSGIASGSDSFAAGIFGTEASGPGSVAFGYGTLANGDYATAFGAATVASGILATAFGDSTTASGGSSAAFGLLTTASGSNASAFGTTTSAFSYGETALGTYNTNYSPVSSTVFDSADRVFVVGNGNGSASDAFTILKNGEVGIGIDNFETNSMGDLFQVGDGSTNVIASIDNTGSFNTISDERKKKNIEDLVYGLDTINHLRPVSFDYKRNNAHTNGFLAQQILP